MNLTPLIPYFDKIFVDYSSICDSIVIYLIKGDRKLVLDEYVDYEIEGNDDIKYSFCELSPKDKKNTIYSYGTTSEKFVVDKIIEIITNPLKE